MSGSKVGDKPPGRIRSLAEPDSMRRSASWNTITNIPEKCKPQRNKIFILLRSLGISPQLCLSFTGPPARSSPQPAGQRIFVTLSRRPLCRAGIPFPRRRKARHWKERIADTGLPSEDRPLWQCGLAIKTRLRHLEFRMQRQASLFSPVVLRTNIGE